VTCWIASEVGKKFSVCWNVPSSGSMTFSGLVDVDGIKCGGKVTSPTSKRAVKKSGVSTSNIFKRLFSFAPLQLTDDDSFLDHSASKDLGEIVLQIWRAAVIGVGDCRPKIPDEQKVHERSKKATSHRVQFDAEVSTSYRAQLKTRYLDKEPLVTFIFKYRSLEILQANGIAPLNKDKKRSAPEPPIEHVKKEHQGVIDHGEDEKAQRIKALEAELKVLKRQSSQSDTRPAKRVKREPLSQSVFVPGEIIDLT